MSLGPSVLTGTDSSCFLVQRTFGFPFCGATCGVSGGRHAVPHADAPGARLRRPSPGAAPRRGVPVKPSQHVVCSKDDPRSGLGERQLSGHLGEVGLGLVGAGGGEKCSCPGGCEPAGGAGSRVWGGRGASAPGCADGSHCPALRFKSKAERWFPQVPAQLASVTEASRPGPPLPSSSCLKGSLHPCQKSPRQTLFTSARPAHKSCQDPTLAFVKSSR